MKLNLSTEEKLTLENNALKIENMSMKINGLQSINKNIIDDFCKRMSKNPKQILIVNIQNGFIEFADEKKPKEEAAKIVAEKELKEKS